MQEAKVHSKLGASSSERWFNCPASVQHSEKFPPLPDSEWSKEGTNAHKLMEVTLLERYKGATGNAHHFAKHGQKLGIDFAYDEAMADHVQNFVDNVERLLRSLKDPELLVEHRFNLKHIHPDLFGTADVVIRTKDKIWVIDFKYGAGIKVEPHDNSQLMYYALGGVYGINLIDEVTLVIAQPRIEGAEWQEWVTSMGHLSNFAKTLRQKAIETQSPKAPFNDGEWCRWCRGASGCPQLSKKSLAAAQIDFREEAPSSLADPAKMSDAQILKVLEAESALDKWIGAIKEQAYLRLMRGEQIEGLKLVRGRASRVWKAPKELGDEFYVREPMSVAQAEKVLGKPKVADKFETVMGRVSLALESDKRAEFKPAIDDFANAQPKKLLTKDDF